MEARLEVYRLLRELLEYPGPDLPAKARRCRDLLASEGGDAAGMMADFVSFLEGRSPGEIEELYTATFDLNPVCCPYAGYQLLGEDDPKRAALMVKLQESYREAGFVAGNELPDHVAVLFGFLAETDDPALKADLRQELLAPALEKMAAALDGKNGYGAALRAARMVLGSES